MINVGTSPIASFARPIGAGCFHAFTVEEDTFTKTIWMVFHQGRNGKNKRRIWAGESLCRELLRSNVIREAMIDMFSHVTVDPLDHLSDYFMSRLVHALFALRQEGTTFMLLRGSEVSLDRLVLMQDSSPVIAIDEGAPCDPV